MDPNYLREILSYDPETGIFRWKVAKSTKIRVGDKAGFKHGTGYIRIKVDSSPMLAHRLAWLHFYGCYPANQIDHINGKREDNRILNLRDVTGRENTRNSRKRTRNTSGFTGVSFHKLSKRWQSRISNKYLGIFYDIQDAIRARKEAETKFGYHPNHGRDE